MKKDHIDYNHVDAKVIAIIFFLAFDVK